MSSGPSHRVADRADGSLELERPVKASSDSDDTGNSRSSDDADLLSMASIRYSCPPDVSMDERDPLTQGRRSTLARIFGVHPQPISSLPVPMKRTSNQKPTFIHTTRATTTTTTTAPPSLSTTNPNAPTPSSSPSSPAPLVCAETLRARDVHNHSPKAIPWGYPSFRPHTNYSEGEGSRRLSHDHDHGYDHGYDCSATTTTTTTTTNPNHESKVDDESSPERSLSPLRMGSPPGPSVSLPNVSSALNRSVSDQIPMAQPALLSHDVVTMHDQVRLLMLNLEEEKKRRASEQKLMQQKILELQSLIRRNFPEQQKALERRVQSQSTATSLAASTSSLSFVPSATGTGSTSHPRVRVVRGTRGFGAGLKNGKNGDRRRERGVSDHGSEDEHAAPSQSQSQSQLNKPSSAQVQSQSQAQDQLQGQGPSDAGNSQDSAIRSASATNRQQLGKLRAKMHAMVVEAQQEARTLKLQMIEERRSFEKHERQLRSDSIVHLAALEEKHTHIQNQLEHTVEHLTAEVSALTEEKRRMQEEMEAKNERIRQLELALLGKAVVDQSEVENDATP